ncbi:MAG: hypothetical protein JXB03_08435 [Spirochaetales bacterium]|nr:hypothetical protein [Spirochaetales bacterium]
MKDTDVLNGLILSLGRKDYSAKELAALAAPFSIAESRIRTWLSRQTAKGFLRRTKGPRGVRYGLSPKGARISANISLSFIQPDWSLWDGRWWGFVFSVPENRKELRHRLRTKLASYRFASWYGGFWIRPRNTTEGVSENFSAESCGHLLAFTPEKKISIDEAQNLWDIGTLNRRFAQACTQISRLMDELESYDPVEAHIKRIETGSRIVPLLFEDPLLPPEFLPVPWEGAGLRKLFSQWDKAVRLRARDFWQEIIVSGGGENE